MSQNVRLGLILALIVLVVIFVLQNAAEVEIKLFFMTFASRRDYLVFSMLVIVVLVGWFANGAYRRRQRDSIEKDPASQ